MLVSNSSSILMCRNTSQRGPSLHPNPSLKLLPPQPSHQDSLHRHPLHHPLSLHLHCHQKQPLQELLQEAKVSRLCAYRIAGNIGGEFNLADWRICESTAKLNSAKYESCPDIWCLRLSDRQIKFRQTAKITNPPNITPANFSGYTVR